MVIHKTHIATWNQTLALKRFKQKNWKNSIIHIWSILNVNINFEYIQSLAQDTKTDGEPKITHRKKEKKNRSPLYSLYKYKKERKE